MQANRKISAVILLLVLSFSGPAVSEIFKVSNLLSHFQDHNDQVQVNFVKFIIDHYAQENGTDDDAEEDRQLPFLSGNLGLVTPYSLPTEQVFRHAYYSGAGPQPVVQTKNLLSDPHLSMIWQPPRFC